MSINSFIEAANKKLVKDYQRIPIFDINYVGKWSSNLRHSFVKNLYHARGHFDRQLFQRAALCSKSKYDKLKKLEDMCDELGIEFNGKDGIRGLLTGQITKVKIMKSHEQLFIDFTEDVGCSIKEEISSYKQPEYLSDYNQALVKLLTNDDELTREVAFSAYEFLDNVDYNCLYSVAVALGASKKGLIFFDVHRHSNHFEKTEKTLKKFWKQNEKKCIDTFNEIFQIQTIMWSNLSLNILKNEN